MRIGLIGCGGQGKLHAEGFANIPDVTLAGMAASSPESARRAAKAIGLRAYDSAGAMIADPAIDAVVVATPGSTHADLACAALGAGKHVLCEVPISLDLDDARRMTEAGARSGRILQIGLIHRFGAPYRLLIDLLNEGRFGAPHAVATQRLSGLRSQGLTHGHHGDAISELLTFDIHLLLWAFGRPSSVSSQAGWNGARAHRVIALFEWPDLMATCFATQDMPADFPFTEETRIDLAGGAITSTVRFWPQRVETAVVGTPTRGLPERFHLPLDNAMAVQARHFVDAAQGRADPAYADAQKATELLEVTLQVREAALSGCRVRLA
jgi:predicted dehydrogenase